MLARWPSKTFRFWALARRALERGRRKLRATPSFTETTSPMAPSFSTRSSRMTIMGPPSLLHDVGQEREEACALDGAGQFPLLLGGDRGDPRRHDLAALGDVALQ